MKTICSAAVALAMGLGAAPAALAKVTATRLVASPTNFTGSCPALIKFSGRITVDRPGTVQYTWVRSDGATAPVSTLTFATAGTQRVGTTWTLGGPSLPTFTGWEQIKVLKPNPKRSNRAKFSIRCRPPTQAQCPDPAASALAFSIASRTSPFAGRVRIVGTVKNVGSAAYESGPNQQSAQLYETAPGGSPRLVAQQAFQNLAPGAEVSVQYERAWNSSSPAEGEFPPSYKLLIVYDPDIALDGNTHNDDCSNANNSRERSGTEINALFR